MKKDYIILLLLLSFSNFITFSQVEDIDGNSYETVIIGTQEWMAENLKTTKFSNGDAIDNITNISDFYNAGIPVWTYYANNDSNNDIYGKLYNGFVAVDSRNCCPTGWRVPSDADWTQLVDYLGGESVAGTKLRNSTIWNGTDEVGFNAMPGGLRYALAGDLNEGTLFGQGFWWSSEYSSNVDIYFYRTETFSSNFYRSAENYTLGMSIRCIKSSILGLIDDYKNEFKDSFVYPNPFSSSATLVLNDKIEGDITIKIFNTKGQLVKEIFKFYSSNSVSFDSDGLPEGFYFYTVNSNGNSILNGKFIIKK